MVWFPSRTPRKRSPIQPPNEQIHTNSISPTWFLGGCLLDMFRKTLSRTIRAQTHSDWVSLFTGWMTIISIRVWSQIEIPDNTSNSYYNRNHHEEKLEEEEEESTPQSHPCQMSKEIILDSPLSFPTPARFRSRSLAFSSAFRSSATWATSASSLDVWGRWKTFFCWLLMWEFKKLNRCLKSLKKRTMGRWRWRTGGKQSKE